MSDLNARRGIVAMIVVVTTALGILAGCGGDDAGTATSAASPTTAPGAGERTRVVASDPRRLGEPGTGGVTFTEFLDFECEACGAAFPAIELLRQEYAGRVTFNVRYFPLPGHVNARTSAHAVEASAQQGSFEEMYARMFETQAEWGEGDSSEAARFRGYAEEIGLDMAAFDAAVAAPATAARVQRDVDAGTALGVSGTPTFFIGEERVEPTSLDDLRRMLDASLDAR